MMKKAARNRQERGTRETKYEMDLGPHSEKGRGGNTKQVTRRQSQRWAGKGGRLLLGTGGG